MSSLRRLVALLAAAALCLGAAACGRADDQGPSGSSPGSGLKIFATTGYLGDAAKNVAPGAEITVMVKPGGDPHTYQPTTRDIEAMQSADIVLWNGLHLEALMIDRLRDQGERGLEVGAGVDPKLLLDWPETDAEGNALSDPHIWNSPEIWQSVVTQIGDKCAETDADHGDEYRANAEAYNAKIAALDEKANARFAAIPEENRVLVTGHDAFNYLGQRYGLTVYATDFVSSEAELSAGDLKNLAAMISEKRVPIIFVDNVKNPQAIRSLQEAVRANGWDVAVSETELYADSLGDASPVDTYLGVFEHNVETIASGLGAQQ
ncbi:MAG: metal ABC transporter substrate-binding protein [Actinomycetaceae bacterium]|nr:metal ABC transporter substrate-binding protein [Actinomycetaceae bacterium]